MPAEFDKRIGDFAVIPRAAIDVETNATGKYQRPGNLLGQSHPHRAQVHRPVETKGAVALLEGAAAGDGEFGVIEEWLDEMAQGQGGTG